MGYKENQHNMPISIIIRGYCGTGKTSVAKDIARKLGYAFLEYDHFLWEFNPTEELTSSDYKIAYKNFISVLKNYVKIKKGIVIEGPLVQRRDYDPFRIEKILSIVKSYKVIIFQLRVNEKEALRRMKKRNLVVDKEHRDLIVKKHNEDVLTSEIIIDTSKLTLKQVENRILKVTT